MRHFSVDEGDTILIWMMENNIIYRTQDGTWWLEDMTADEWDMPDDLQYHLDLLWDHTPKKEQ